MSAEKRDRLRIALITNARSDYTTIYPVMKRAMEDDDIDEKIICGGMHLSEKFGNTWKQLEKDGLRIDARVPFFEPGDSNRDLGISIGKGAVAFTELLSDMGPDVVLLSGDRVENMAVYSATLALNLPVAHLCGGDITEGSRDNQVRHMMTKLSHLHYVSMEEHARRVRQMGEEPWRVIISGDAAIDAIKSLQVLSRAELQVQECIPESANFCMCTFHPSTLGDENDEQQLSHLLDFLAILDVTPVIVYPNIDPGHEKIIEQFKVFHEKRPDAIMRKNFSRVAYYSLMSHAEFIVGNTSSGIWEAPSFGLPSINIGTRQQGRARAGNVIDISGTDRGAFDVALAQIRSDAFQEQLQSVTNPYGDGHAAETILEHLKQVPIDEKLLVKRFVDMS